MIKTKFQSNHRVQLLKIIKNLFLLTIAIFYKYFMTRLQYYRIKKIQNIKLRQILTNKIVVNHGY